ncbi:MAG: MATE family efflux transporter, partial [Spirochaetales bacterium]|nr:MATE family efflux transporter [Spirochaetales bacterium]
NTYLQILLLGAVLIVVRMALTGFFAGIGRTKVVMAANITAMLINLPANYLLIFGRAGLPALGIRGAAIGTLCGSFSAFLILFITYLRVSRSEEYRGDGQWRYRPAMMKRLLTFGVPAGLEMFLNVGAFNLFVNLMHTYGPDVAAAVTIAFNWDIVAFIPMLGLGVATTALVARHIGAGDYEGAEQSARLTLLLGYIYSGFMMILFLSGARSLVAVFASGFSDPSGEISRLAIILVRLASLYTLADSTQLIFAGALRGAGDTRWIMRFSVTAHWILAFLAFLLIKIFHASPVMVWCVFIMMVVIMGTSMFLRFRAGKWKNIRLIGDE